LSIPTAPAARYAKRYGCKCSIGHNGKPNTGGLTVCIADPLTFASRRFRDQELDLKRRHANLPLRTMQTVAHNTIRIVCTAFHLGPLPSLVMGFLLPMARLMRDAGPMTKQRHTHDQP